jgi:hypothetical protein
MNLTDEQIKGLKKCLDYLYEGVWIDSQNKHYGTGHSSGYDFVSIDWVNYVVFIESENYDLHEFISLIDKFKVDGVNSEWIYESNFK